MRPSVLLLAICLSVLGGCTAPPFLGEGWETLDLPARDTHAAEVLRGLFAESVDSTGSARPDRKIVRCDAVGISYQPPGDGAESTLRWADVESVQSVTAENLPARPETLLIYMVEGSPSLDQLSDLVFTPLASAGISQPYLELRHRPRWSRNRMLAALNHLRPGQPSGATEPTQPEPAQPDDAQPDDAQPDDAQPDDAQPDDAQPDDALEAIERKLLKLKQWHEQGLIDDAIYEAKRQELLEGL